MSASVENELRQVVRDTFMDLLMDHGNLHWSVEQISEKTGIPSAKLWDDDYHTGILAYLADNGFLVREGRSFAIDCMAIDFRWGR